MLFNTTNWVRDSMADIAIRILKQGPIPKHVGFILDGNRRFAKKNTLGHAIQGHRAGFTKLVEICEYCRKLGVKEITIYVFSIENFKRPQDEIDGIMELLIEVLPEYTKMHARGTRIEVIGNWPTTQSPEIVKQILADSMMVTRNNDQMQMNIAFSYTARNEIVTGATKLLEAVSSGTLSTSDIDETTLEQSFRVYPSYPVDLLVRTSGETRLSDFLLWQTTQAFLDFIDMEWPALKYRDFAASIWRYQQHILSSAKAIDKSMGGVSSLRANLEEEDRRREAVDRVRAERWRMVELCHKKQLAVN